MDQLDPEQQESLRKFSTERLRSKLVKADYDEEMVFAMERSALLELMAQHLLRSEAAVGNDPVTADPAGVRLREIDLRERELRLREAEFRASNEQRVAELELRRAEIRLQEQRMAEDIEWRHGEARRLRIRDEQMAERESSLPALTKKYGDIMKHVLPRMPTDPGELMTFWDTCENLWSVYEVPEILRAKLLLPLLNPKAKSLVSRLSVDELGDVNKIKEFLLKEFRLTSREYRARFNAATRATDETYTLFMNRLKNLWSFYMRSRDCDDFDKLVDLVIADRLKDSLTGPCLKYCLAVEGQKTLSASELAALADQYDVNYTADGRYRGGSVVTSPPPPSGASRVVPHSQHNTQIQRRCWTCGSPSHMRSACPRVGGTSPGAGQINPRSARVGACATVKAAEKSCQPSKAGDDTTLVKVQVNHCVIETAPSQVNTSGDDTCLPHELMLHTNKADQLIVAESVQTVDDGVNVCNDSYTSSQIRSGMATVQTSPLVYLPVMVENGGPYKCLSDSGAEIPVAKDAVVADPYPAPEAVGQVKLQGIFGEPVTADLVTLHVNVLNPDTGHGNGRPVPLTFAVTRAMVQDCDLVIPAAVIHTLQGQSVADGRPTTVSASVLTRSQARASTTLETDTEKASHSDQLLSADESTEHRSAVTDLASDADEVGLQNDPVAEDAVVNNADNPRLLLTHEGDKSALSQEQRSDATLDPCWRLAEQGKGGMMIEDEILYHLDEVGGHRIKQLCVPYGRRLQVMQMAHDSITSGHLASRKTRDRIRLNFYWPNLKRDVFSYTSSCVHCQLRARARRTDHVPIVPVVRPSVPFVVCHADVIGPIEPPSAQGRKWALCIIDDCTRWPAVYLMKSLTAKATCQAFLELFSLTGWPEILCTDQGTNLCSQMTQEFLRRMGVSPRIHSPYHSGAGLKLNFRKCTFAKPEVRYLGHLIGYGSLNIVQTLSE